MFSQTRVFELYRLRLLLLFLLLLSSLFSKLLNTVLLISESGPSHLIILTTILIVFVFIILLVHTFFQFSITFHVSIKSLVLIIIVGRSIFHHTVNRSVARISTFLSFNVSSNFFLDPLFLLVELRWLILANFTHQSWQATSCIWLQQTCPKHLRDVLFVVKEGFWEHYFFIFVYNIAFSINHVTLWVNFLASSVLEVTFALLL